LFEQLSLPPSHLFFRLKHFLKKPPRAFRPCSQQLFSLQLFSQQLLAHELVQTGTSFSTHLRTMRQQVTVSQDGTQTRTVRVH